MGVMAFYWRQLILKLSAVLLLTYATMGGGFDLAKSGDIVALEDSNRCRHVVNQEVT